MKTFQSLAREKDAQQIGGLESSGQMSAQRKDYASRTNYPSQRMIDPLIVNAGVVQLTVDSAAQEFFENGYITVKKADLKGPFKKTHAVTDKDLKKIQEKLSELRLSAPKKEKPKTVDMSNSDNWYTEGGMNEGDAKVVAESLGWIEDVTQWTCQDKSHTPKGKVYTNGEGAYYGADNTGHVGWGFKVWEVNKGKELKYKGNISWNGTRWVHDKRGTK